MPLAFVVVVVLTPVCRFVIATFAPGTTALDGSKTVPLISPLLAFCENARDDNTITISSTNKRLNLRDAYVVISSPPEFAFRRLPKFVGRIPGMLFRDNYESPAASELYLQTKSRESDESWSR